MNTYLFRNKVCLKWLFCLFVCGSQAAFAQEPLYVKHIPEQDRPSGSKYTERVLLDVLEELKVTYKTVFVFEKSNLEGKLVSQPVDSSQKLEELLRQILPPLQLQFKKLKDGGYAIVPVSKSLQINKISPQSNMMAGPYTISAIKGAEIGNLITGQLMAATITGRVTDDKGEGLPGVNVLLKGTTSGSTTNADGNYTLNVAEANGTLIFSYIGYATQEVAINGRTVVNISLQPDVKSLSEVVVVGYGTQKKSDLTGSVSSIKSEQITAFPASGVVQTLQGRAAGVQIQANNGEPGASFKVRIRGGTSINASSDPVYVVDGFIGGQIPPPEDIASVEVLKDASATAIYGSRGANGVIMITTKRGKAGKTRIELSSSYSYQTEINRLKLLNADQFVDYIRDGVNPDYQSQGANTDWQEEVFRPGGIQNYQLSFTGGNESVNYYVSGSYFDQEGIIINSNFKRFSITSNLDFKASDRFRVGLNIFAQRATKNGVRTQEDSGGATQTGIVASAFKFGPDLPIYNDQGVYTIALIGDPIDNPVAIARERENESVVDRFQGNFFAEYDLLKSLKFRTSFGVSTNSDRTGEFTPTTLNAGRNSGGDARVDGDKNTLLLNENYLTYNTGFGEAHNLTLLGGYSIQKSTSESWGGRGQSLITDAFSYWNLGSATVLQAPNSAFSENQIASFYARANYSLLNRYLFTFNARYDGSSNFSKNNKWAFFPSGAFAWNMKNEEFMSGLSFINSWKWRASYGLTGNQAISPYQTLARFSSVFTVINGVPVNAVRPTAVANDDLTWETTAQFDIGTDIGILDDRINLTLDYYRMVTSDLLFSVPLPQYSGFPSQLKNIGKVGNKGFEVSVASRNLTGEFKWNMDVNVSANRNKVLQLPDGNELQYGSGPGHIVGLGNTQILREGYPVGSFFGWIYDGVYQEGDNFIPGGGFEQTAGGEKYRDIEGVRDDAGQLTGQPDGVLNSDDRTIIGNPNPDFIFGFNNDFKWKNFDLNIFFQGSQGNDILSYTLLELERLAGYGNSTTRALQRWTPTNTDTDVPKVAVGRPNRLSTRFIYDGSFVRLKNLALGYNLPTALVNRIGVSRFRIYVSAQNILTFTKYEGYDPEVNYRSGGGADSNRNLGLDYASFPNAKSYTIGINLGF